MRGAFSVGAGIALAVALFLTPACATMESIGWASHNIAEVIKRLGAPKATIPVGDLTAYVWDQEKEIVQSLRTTINPDGGFETPAYCKRWIFFVDRNGTITSWRTENLPWWCAREPLKRGCADLVSSDPQRLTGVFPSSVATTIEPRRRETAAHIDRRRGAQPAGDPGARPRGNLSRWFAACPFRAAPGRRRRYLPAAECRRVCLGRPGCLPLCPVGLLNPPPPEPWNPTGATPADTGRSVRSLPASREALRKFYL